MEDVLVLGGGARTSSEHYRGALEQCTEFTNAHIEPCDELATNPGVDPTFAHYIPPIM